MPGMTFGLSKWQKSRHSSYSYPLWRFLRKIGWVFSSSIACRFPREKRVLLSVQRLVATADPVLIISRVVRCWASRLGCGVRFGWILPAFDRVPVDRHG